ncbi:DUF58 domain-containing protein [Tundrisphaera lichenicola]|uniref:DUF58 domain-containing protein n=1 Tax=Tundrisphaera lichenicola TaxID=2029860 RepID=UPI003EBCC183
MPDGRKPIHRLMRWVVRSLWPNQKLRWTREGAVYFFVWIGLLLTGLQQQINLILLIAGLAAGPMVGSIFVSASMLRRLRIARRVPPYAFSGDPLAIDYTLENDRRWTAALALVLTDEMTSVDRTVSGTSSVFPTVFFPRVAGRSRARVRWQGVAPRRGNYLLRNLDLSSRSPFGLLERRVAIGDSDELMVYPEVGHLSRRWQHINQEASETRRGSRHDRSTQQQEYHGLRDYRPGDSPRWIHWRTTARLGQPMVKEFEQQHEQDLGILLDPWIPRTKVTPEQREAMEDAIKFVATVCLETCRHPGRRLLLGWTGSTPSIRQGPASVKLLHELLEQLAMVRPSTERDFSSLLDMIPPSTLREAMIIVVSTRPINLMEEAERSGRLSVASLRGLMGRATIIDVSKGELDGLITFGKQKSRSAPIRRQSISDGSENQGPNEDRPTRSMDQREQFEAAKGVEASEAPRVIG